MGLFDKRKKKQLIEKINSVRFEKIDNEFFEKYDFSIISKLDSEDYFKSLSELSVMLDLISLVGKKLNNINAFSLAIHPQLKELLKSKEDYMHLDWLCSKFEINIIAEYITLNNISKINEVTFEKIEEFINVKEEKKKIDLFFKENNIKNPSVCSTYQEAVNYAKIINFLVLNGIDLNRFYQIYWEFSELFLDINIDELDDKDRKNLIEYCTIIFNNTFEFKLNSYNDLLNYNVCKQDAIDNYFLANPNDISAFFYMIINVKDFWELMHIFNECNDLQKISCMSLENYGFSSKELELLNILGLLQNSTNSLLEIYKGYRESGNNFKDVDLFNFRNKLREVYAKEISSSLTKLVDDGGKTELSNTTCLGDKEYGVPIYEKSDGEFKFVVHSIINGLTVNSSISSENSKNNVRFFNNPELWDNFSKERGTNALSASLISSNGAPFLGTKLGTHEIVIYGFDELDSKSVRNISYTDGMTSHNTDGYEAYGGSRESMMFSDDLIENALSTDHAYPYNEVAFNRYNDDGTRKKPNFIICFDVVSLESINHAQYHNVPILVIKTEKYIEKFEASLIASKESYMSCDKNNLNDYYAVTKKYLFELIRYYRFPNFTSRKKFDITLDEIKEIQQELEELKKAIKENSIDSSIVMLH